MSTLQQIVERLEAGETGREIDALVADALGILPENPGDRIQFVGLPEDFDVEQMARDCVTPELSTSLDAVAALHEKLLPGWGIIINSFEITSDRKNPKAIVHLNRFGVVRGEASTITAAWLAAILKALIATGEERKA